MFNKTTELNDIKLAFLDSLNVQAFPCGRRRSELVDKDGKSDTVNDRYYIPFDPEARLNTEANNRKYSSLNGFDQTYLKDWIDSDDYYCITMSLAGYLFKITLEKSADDKKSGYDSQTIFSNALCESLATEPDTDKVCKIYANIRLEDVKLFSGYDLNYNTYILRDQSASNEPETSLDLLIDTSKSTSISSNYYFSGLSFSVKPLGDQNSTETRSCVNITTDDMRQQQIVSLCILEKPVAGTWQIHQQAYLPKIEHGDTDNSVIVGDVSAGDLSARDISAANLDTDNITADTIKVNGTTVPEIKLVKQENTYQLQFIGLDIVN